MGEAKFVERSAAIRAYCAKSTVLDADDVTWGEMGGSSSTIGRRYRVGVLLVHRPTKIEVTRSSEKPGGRTRAEVKQLRAALYLEALEALEGRVRQAQRAERRRRN